jgi:hypothetical protein
LPINLPELQILIGNISVNGVISLEVEKVAYFAADRFALTLAVGANPLLGISYFATLGTQVISISIATNPSGYVELITGQVDNIRFDLPSNTVTLCGRDLSARLIDTEISETFVNQTASQIATTIAGRHGLTANVTATSVPVGQYYELDHARSALGLNSRGGSEWNMLCFLAQAENFILSVTGTTLNFGPAIISVPVFLMPANCIALSLDVSTTIPTGVSVKSWNTRNKAVINQSSGSKIGNATTMIRPNLTSQQAVTIANNHLLMLAQHTTILMAKLPGETTLAPGSQILVNETNSPFDQLYMVDAIIRSVEAQEGFVESIHAHAVVN